MDSSMLSFIGFISFCYSILLLSLSSRISRWTYETQRKLDTTNELLRQLLAGRQ